MGETKINWVWIFVVNEIPIVLLHPCLYFFRVVQHSVTSIRPMRLAWRSVLRLAASAGAPPHPLTRHII